MTKSKDYKTPIEKDFDNLLEYLQDVSNDDEIQIQDLELLTKYIKKSLRRILDANKGELEDNILKVVKENASNKDPEGRPISSEPEEDSESISIHELKEEIHILKTRANMADQRLRKLEKLS